MQAYDFNRLGADMDRWMNQRFMDPIAYQNYGWEYWIQIDFIAWLDQSYGAQFDFQREIPWGGSRLDWLANQNSPGTPLTGLEIKAQTIKAKASDFVASVDSDVAKLQAMAGLAQKMMIVGVVSPEVQQALNARGFVPLTQPAGGADAVIYQKAI